MFQITVKVKLNKKNKINKNYFFIYIFQVTGTWYMIAVATESCLATTIMNALFELSGKIHINATDAPKVYSLEYNIKL